MKTKTTLLLILFSALNFAKITAQTPVFEWASKIGGISYDYGSSIATDKNGNIYTTGYFADTVDFDPGAGVYNLSTLNNSRDIFVQKLDANKNLIWAKQMIGAGVALAYSITIDANENVLITGQFNDTVDFDPDTGIVQLAPFGRIGINTSIFVLKLNSNGNFLWVKHMGSATSNSYGRSIISDNNGNVYTTGSFTGLVDFNPGLGTFNLTASTTINDIYVQKLDSSGNFLWAKQISGANRKAGRSITIDLNGNLLITGQFSGTADFDPGTNTYNLTAVNGIDMFVLKMSPNGNLIWVKQIGGNSNEIGKSITSDINGNIYTTGYFQSQTDFDPGASTYNLTAIGLRDIFVQKLDANGNFQWAKQMGGTGDDEGNSITTDINGYVYTTGSFQRTVDFDPDTGTNNLTVIGGADIFIQKLDSNGSLMWAKHMGGFGNDDGTSITVDTIGNVYTTGYFNYSADFDPGSGTTNLLSSGFDDVFIQKLIQCFHTEGVDTILACDSYTWIDGITYFSSNNTAKDTLTNSAGCDSIITLDLTINTLDSSVTQNGTVLTANVPGANYQWLDCVNSFAPITNGTNQSYTASINGSYAVEITKNGCVDTSACFSVSPVGLIENSLSDKFMVYPNPTEGNFSIKFENIQEFLTVRLLSLSGQVILDKTFLNSNLIDLEIDQANGIYLLEIRDGKDNKAVFNLFVK
ncbi:MAG: hypothetical protein ACJAV5_001490 [Vicingaceae bacterium]|jgi:hypothetical protein